jgi:hypothetical protein
MMVAMNFLDERLPTTFWNCRSGHPYDLFFDGYRRCSICTTTAKRKYKAKLRAARRRKETRP